MKHDKLNDFVSFFLQQDIAHLSALEFYDYGSVLSLVLYRDATRQAELFVLRPGVGFPRQHRHPDVDSYEYILSACVPLIVNGVDVSAGDGGMGLASAGNLGALYRVDSTDWHGVGDVPEGGSFVSLQEWKNGVEPTSAGLNWEGTPVSEAHRRLLRRPDAAWVKTLNRNSMTERAELLLHANPR